ncbi:DNA ligase 3 [Paragonimus heterotremus]|uniref:DNA ligase 3 n=1 Tax=Paragonimus heterotremus TaxID=100268 RepID=A0A8J4SZG2_9TREM|nr:DNA ligase 3 [Paragonimus heterotremus]
MEDFSVLCDQLRMATGHKHRAKIVSDFLKDSDEYGFGGDLNVLFRCLLPKESKLVYNIKDKQLVNLFSQVFERDKDEMLSDLEKAEDAATTIGKFFASGDCAIFPAHKSTLTLQEVSNCFNLTCTLSRDLVDII